MPGHRRTQSADLVPLNRVEPFGRKSGQSSLLDRVGEAGLYWDGGRHEVFASEGGHADFAPREICRLNCCSISKPLRSL